MTVHVLDTAGHILGAYPDLPTARHAAHTRHVARYYVVTRGAVVLAYRPGVRLPSAGWLERPAPASPVQRVWAALAHPRTLDSLCAVLPDLTREQIARLIFELVDDGHASHTMTPAGYVLARVDDPSPGEGRVAG